MNIINPEFVTSIDGIWKTFFSPMNAFRVNSTSQISRENGFDRNEQGENRRIRVTLELDEFGVNVTVICARSHLQTGSVVIKIAKLSTADSTRLPLQATTSG